MAKTSSKRNAGRTRGGASGATPRTAARQRKAKRSSKTAPKGTTRLRHRVVRKRSGKAKPGHAPAGLAKRRRKSVLIVAGGAANDDGTPSPRPSLSGQASLADQPTEADGLAPPADEAALVERLGKRTLTIPEEFLLFAVDANWDERRERLRPGSLGAALAGAMALELLLRERVQLRRDRLAVVAASSDAPLQQALLRLRKLGNRDVSRQLAGLARGHRRLLLPFKQDLVNRGLVESRTWRHLGLFYRSTTTVRDERAQDRLKNRLGRAIAGGGRPDAPTILLLGLIDAAGLLEELLPPSAVAYNRKRIHALLAGVDPMGYKVDDVLKGMQKAGVLAVMAGVRVLTMKG